MALLTIFRGTKNKKADAPVFLRIITEDGRVLTLQADAGDFSLCVATHTAISVVEVEPVVARPSAS